jgi:hypothetical protein
LIAFALRRDVIPVERLLALAGVGYGAVNAVKFVHLFVLATVLLLAPAFVARRGEAQQVRAPRATGVLAINVLLLVGLLAVALAAYWPGAVCLRAGSWAPDPVVGQALRNGNVSGSIVVNFAWGEYVIWHFGPRLKVSFDPRYDLVYSPRTIAEQSGIRTVGAEAVAFLERARPGYVWFPQSDARLKAWLVAHGYRIDVDTAASFIAVRDDVPRLQNPGPQFSGCFPSL